MSAEHIRTVIVDDPDDPGRLVARRIAEVVRAKAAAGSRAALGLPTGSIPEQVHISRGDLPPPRALDVHDSAPTAGFNSSTPRPFAASNPQSNPTSESSGTHR